MKAADLALILTGVLLNATAQLFLKSGARALGDWSVTLSSVGTVLARALQSAPIGAGLACYAVSLVVWILALTRVPVSVAYPMLSIGYVVNALAAWLRIRPTARS